MSFVEQSIQLTAVAPALTWRQDAALAPPELRFPVDGARYCPDIIRLYGQFSGVRLSWDAVSGASFYVVQLCTDQSFKGTTVLGIRTVSAYCDLNYIEHISLAQKVYWRVFAYSANGGTSPSSKVRYLAIECPESSGVDYNLEDTGLPVPGTSKCDQAGVDIAIVGPEQVRKSETERGWVLNVNFDCKAFENQSLEIQDIQWSLNQSSQSPVSQLKPDAGAGPDDSFLFTASVDSSRVETFELKVEITFAYGSETFKCSKTKRVLIEGEGASGGGSLYLAELSEVDCIERTAVGTILKGPCGASLPSEPVDIVDELGCNLTGPSELLNGKVAWVTQIRGTATQYVGACHYAIVTMCCDSFAC